MSFEEYCNHMKTKYTIATALAVIRSKPHNLTIDEYITELKQKLIRNPQIDGISITSNDFNMDDDDSDITEDNVEVGGRKVTDDEMFPVSLDAMFDDMIQSPTILANFDIEMEDNETDCGTDIVDCRADAIVDEGLDTASVIDTITDQGKHVETIKQLINTNSKNGEAIDITNLISDTQDTHCSFNNSEIQEPPNKKKKIDDDDIGNNIFDSQATELYSVPGYDEENTHISQSQVHINRFELLEMYVLGTRRPHDKDVKAKVNNDTNAGVPRNDFNFKQNKLPYNEANEISTDVVLDKRNDTSLNESSKGYHSNEHDYSSKSTQENNVKYSKKVDEAMKEKIPIQVTNEHKQCTCKFERKDRNEQLNFPNDYDFTQIDYENREPNVGGTNLKPNTKVENTVETTTQSICNDNKYKERDFRIGENSKVRSNNEKLIVDCDKYTNTIQTQTPEHNYTLDLESLSQSTQSQGFSERPNIKPSSREHERFQVNDEDDHNTSQDPPSPPRSAVPFKVLEDLSRVRRRLAPDSDSGYRSDGRGAGSRPSLDALNQSAHTLVMYLTDCPVDETVRNVASEISQTLGDLIDALHSNENYPPFLDQLLDTINTMLQDILDGESSTELFEKEVSIYRLLNLNVSHHTIKHTIERITDALTRLHAGLTSPTQLHEITETAKVENMSYVFSVLETLLKRYFKSREKLSQSSSQMSQDSTPKYSGVIDIWKRKWDPSYKARDADPPPETSDISEKLANILNRITIDCMDGYALVAYAALQCFNMLQA